VAAQLVSACVGPAYTYVVRNSSFLAAQPLRMYRKGGKAGTGRKLTTYERKAHIKRWSGKVATAMDSASEVIEVTNHPALDLIANPNPYWSGVEMEELNFRFGIMAGNAYQAVSDEGNGEHMLWPVPPQFMVVQADKTDIIRSYFFGRDQSDTIELDPSEVLHYRNRLDRNCPYMGEGDISHILPGIDLIRDVAIHDLSFAQNGYSPDHLFKMNDQVTQDQMDSQRESIGSWWSNRRKAGMPYLLKGLENVFPLNTPPKDLRTPEQLEMYRKEIRQALGWTESMSDSNDSTFAGGKIAEGQYGRYIADKLARDASQKSQFFGDLYGFDPDEMFFVYDDPIASNEAADEDRQIRLVSGGLATVNEARAAIGLDPSKDKNAEVLMFNGVPLGEVAGSDPFGNLFGRTQQDGEDTQETGNADLPRQKIEETALNGAQIAQLVELARQVGSGEITRAAAQAVAEAAFPGIPPEKIASIFENLVEGTKPQGSSDAGVSQSETSGQSSPPAPQADKGGGRSNPPARSVDLVKVAMSVEAERWTNGECCCITKDDDDYAGNAILRDVASRYLRSLMGTSQEIVTEAQAQALRQAADGSEPDLSNLRQSTINSMAEALRPLVEMSMEQALGQGQAVPDDAFDLVPTRAVEFLNDYTPRLADDILGTTGEMARVAVQRGLEEGLTVREVANAIEGVPAYRAEMIARTELSNASHEGMIAGWKEAGITSCKWVTAPGPSRAHAMIAERAARAPGEVWVKAGETLGKETFKTDVRKPPARPNCRCSLQPVFEEVE
jgi:phage portal protein BeeE